uniref:Uncharacterized protein LOC111127367 isoform X2 n=1 Tax=Crassostrea virginica TaxID=6565 RepID=A0A8B8DKV5_CRAVI|nr:uncharacterized protein LOC111127367 isoform X2 [Crassostrea virginica]
MSASSQRERREVNNKSISYSDVWRRESWQISYLWYLLLSSFQFHRLQSKAPSYDCKDKWGAITEEFCTFEILYVRIKLEEPLKNTYVEYTVRSGATKDQGESGDVSVVAIIVPFMILFCVLVSIAIVCCIYRNRARQQQGQGGAVLYNPTQIPHVNVQQNYTPVGQNQPQGHPYPVQRYSEPPQQVQTNPPQEYSIPPPQVQTYTQPSAPVAYPYPPGQEVYSSQTATSAHQHSSDTGEPPSYDEVTKQEK